MSGFETTASSPEVAKAAQGPMAATARPQAKVPVSALARLKSGSRWFYWVAGLSLVNTAAAFTGGHMHFVMGLGITRIVDLVARKAGAAATLPALVIDVMIAAAFLLIGLWSSRCNQFAFGIGMLLYAADGALLVLAHDYLSVAFHGLALFYMYRGFAAAQQLQGLADLGKVRASAPVG
ncbi:MAG TPA: hypothetical protein VMT05_04540 [Terriglobales bacterium]|jgi:hypothetical protein|nr:hypothetical protein [Terriglobales bacterium]